MFGISISGIKNSQKHIDVTSNNIANTNSYGFKKSRAEFADVYANSVYTNSRVTTGMGVQNTVVSQQFAQGALSGDTGNPLDMAIQGNGFFVLSGPNGDQSHTYTRNGAFQVDNEGYIVTATGDYLQGWDVDDQGRTASLDLNATHNIQIPSDTGAPKQSNNISIGVNVPADSDQVGFYDPSSLTNDPWTGQAAKWPQYVTGEDDAGGPVISSSLQYGIPRSATDGSVIPGSDNGVTTSEDFAKADFIQYYVNFDPNDSSTYTNSTSQTVHDSLGGAHTLTYYFLNMGPKGPTGDDANTSVWVVIPYLDGAPVDVAKVEGQQGTVVSVPENASGPCRGANFFGFRMEFDSSGELSEASGHQTIPGNVEFVNGTTQGTTADLRSVLFGDTGALANVDDDTFTLESVRGDNTLANGTLHTAMGTGINPDQILSLDMSATQYGSSNFDVSQSPTDDGYATGVLTSISVDENGVIIAEYTNGSIYNIAKVAMADFVNQQGLTKIGDTQWRESLSSGPAIASEANSGSTGSIKGSNLELSNVDLTTELVELITAQRNYQANAQSLQTQNTVMDSILNIR